MYELYESGKSYSLMNTTRSALSSFVLLEDGLNVGTHPLLCRFFKGIFNLRPPLPRYTHIWDVRIILNHLRSLSPIKYLSLKNLTLKLCMLLALLSAQRCQSIHKLRIDKIKINGNSVTFDIDDLIKTSRPGKVGQQIELHTYPPDMRLCIKLIIKTYLERTKFVRNGENQLFLSYVKPHNKVSKDTISRWIRTCMANAGIDVQVFKAHSVRAASVSAAEKCFLPMKDIISKAGWSNEKTFQKYYHKPTLNNADYTNKILSIK